MLVALLCVLLLGSAHAGRIARPVISPTPQTSSTSTTSTTTTTTTTTSSEPTPTPAPPHDCPTCVELDEPIPDGVELGACCFGRTALATGVPESRCRGVWAGPDTAAEDCEHLRPCCNPLSGECTQRFCADCFESGGISVEYCEQCEIAPTPQPSPTRATRPTKPHLTTGTTVSVPAPTPKGPPLGACCLPTGQCSECTQAQCHSQGGIFRGDYTWCDEDTCLRKCCSGTLQCSIVSAFGECDGTLGPFASECLDDDDECGVTCCLRERCTVADSVEDCIACQGVPQLGNDCDDEGFTCGGACCNGIECTFAENEEACLGDLIGDKRRKRQIQLPVPIYTDGVSCNQTGVCGGACCLPNGEVPCRVGSQMDCEIESGIFQGNDTSCGPINGPFAPICMDDGACCVDGEVQEAASLLDCIQRGGVYQGAGSTPQDDDVLCGVGACCEGSGCIEGQTALECARKDGSFAGLGTTCDMEAICDQEGGACCCKDKCVNMPSEEDCRAYGGRSFQGVGSSCLTTDICEVEEGDGACCTPRSYITDGALCSFGSEEECLFRGGVFQGAGTECGLQDDGESYQCREVRGACCVPGDDRCYDDLLISECRECGGHFAGDGVSCSDDYVCDPHHRGACCKAGWPCKETTHVYCLREGGNFQGFGTTCNDHEGQVCAVCLPCEVDRPEPIPDADCVTDADCPDNTFCLVQYGLCAVAAKRIPSQHGKPPGWQPTQNFSLPALDPWWHTDDGKKYAAKNRASMLKSRTKAVVGEGEPPIDDLPMNLGPLSCGPASTIGHPCVVHPRPGKCGIGVCMAPPDDAPLTDECESVCRLVREYPCGCECRDAWLESCASIAGHIYDDRNANGENDGSEGGIVGAVVQLYRLEGDGNYTFVSEEVTRAGGHYAFGGIPGGRYRVDVTLPGDLQFHDGHSSRHVTVECLEDIDGDGHLRKRGVEAFAVKTQTTLEHRNKQAHLVEDVDFFAVPAGSPTPPPSSDEDDDDTGNGTSTGTVIAIIVGAVLACCLCALCVWLVLLRRPARRTRRVARSRR